MYISIFLSLISITDFLWVRSHLYDNNLFKFMETILQPHLKSVLSVLGKIHVNQATNIFVQIFFLFLFFVFLGHIQVPRLGIELEP